MTHISFNDIFNTFTWTLVFWVVIGYFFVCACKHHIPIPATRIPAQAQPQLCDLSAKQSTVLNYKKYITKTCTIIIINLYDEAPDYQSWMHIFTHCSLVAVLTVTACFKLRTCLISLVSCCPKYSGLDVCATQMPKWSHFS